MTTIGERLKALRKELKLTQIEFGGRIAVSQGHLTAMENGKRDVTDKTIKVICMEFNVSETWLRTGEGEMFAETNESILAELAAEYHLEGERYTLIRNFLMLTDEQQEAIARAMLIVAEANKKAAAEAAKKEATAAEEKAEPPAPDASDVDTPEGITPDPVIEERVARFRAQEYARKKARQTSAISLFTEDFGTKKDPPR